MRRLRHFYTIFILSISILSVINCCDRNLEETNSDSEVTKVIGSSGGTIEVTSPNSRLYGVKVDIPYGVLSKNNNITISIDNSGLTIPVDVQLLSEIVSFSAEDTAFNGFVKISIPFRDIGINKDLVRVFKWDETTSSWNITFLDKIDKQANLITIITNHFSSHAVLYSSIDTNKEVEFDPFSDGFLKKNRYEDCYGMASFAKWWWENKRIEEGSLVGWDTAAQYGIAAKAHHLTKYYNYDYTTALANSQANTDYDAVNSIAVGISVNLKPKIVLFKYTLETDAVDRYHAVLAISSLPIGNNSFNFRIYDPDFPRETRTLTFDGSKFLPYHFYLNGSTVIVNGIYLIPDDGYSKIAMEEVFRVYDFGFLPYTYNPNPLELYYGFIGVDGVMGKSRNLSHGAEFEVFGEYELKASSPAAIVPSNYSNASPGSWCFPQKVYREGKRDYYSVYLRVNEVSQGWEQQINIGFFAFGGDQFVGNGYGGGAIILPK